MTPDQQHFLSDFFDGKDIEEPDPQKYKVISVRLREAEYAILARQAAAAGLSHNMALRIAARRIGGFLEIDNPMRSLLQDILREIGQLSRNMNGLKSACSATGKVDMTEFARQRTAFGREFARLDSCLSTILNISRCRRDGRLLLEEEPGS
ncbi:DNA mobilization endonuclease VirD1/MobC family subunit [Agrobacterium tumefaciens]|nr:DNA mobilization endonuclease VirD1/MobC family subunit [Agrobacterium tumefaciens]